MTPHYNNRLKRCPYCGLYKETVERRPDLLKGRDLACDYCYEELTEDERESMVAPALPGSWDDEPTTRWDDDIDDD